MSHGRAIATNTAWMIGGKILTTVFALLMTAALTHSLGVAGFGEYTTAFAYLTLFGALADFGFFQILVREAARRPAELARITGTILTIRSIFGILVYGLAAVLVWFFPYSVTVQTGAVILAAASFILSVNSTLIAVFQARHEMSKAALGDVISRGLLLIGLLALLRLGVGLPELFYWYVATNLVNLLISFVFLRPIVRPRFTLDLARWRYYLAEVWPLGVVSLLAILYFKIDILILSVAKPSSDVGIYGVAYKIFEILTILPAVFVGNVFPAVTQLQADPVRQARISQAAFDILLILGVGTSVGLIVLARPVIGVVAGPEFQAASTVSLAGLSITAAYVVALLAVALIAIFLANLWSTLVTAAGEQRRLLPTVVWGLIVNVLLNLILIRYWSYLGAALAALITQGVIMIGWQRVARKTLSVMPTFRHGLKIMLVGGLMGVAVWFGHDLPLAVPIVVGLGLYVGLLRLWRVIPNDWWLGARPRGV